MELITRIPTEIYETDNFDEFEVSEAAGVKALWNDETAECELINIGTGADWVVVLQTIGTVVETIKVGMELVEKIIDYKKAARKLLEIKNEEKLIAVDADGAKLLSLQKISEYEDLTSIEFIDQMVVPLVDLNGPFRDKRSGLARHPFNHYTFALKVNNEMVYITGVTPSGDVEITRCYDCIAGQAFDKTKDLVRK